MNFIYGMLTMWMLLSIFLYFITFHTKQTTNWDDWFYTIVCFPFLGLAIPAAYAYSYFIKVLNKIYNKIKKSIDKIKKVMCNNSTK